MPKFLKRALLLLSAAALLSVSLCACAGDTTSGESPTDSAVSGESSKRDSVTVGIFQDLDSLDPHKAVNAGTSEVLFNIFEGLMKASPDGGVIPAVASDYGVSEDGMTYTFVLRDGVKFHNGAEVTIEDVVYSLERCAGSENDGTPLIAAFSNVVEVIAEGENKVVVKLADPSLEFINSMTAAIIPAGSGSSQATAPVGTGPFAFVSFAPQDNMKVQRFDDYWGDKAHLESVTFKIVPDVNTGVLALKGGTLDMVIHMPSTMAVEVKDYTVLEDTMKLVQALYINNNVKPFDDVRVRQAMYYAINVPEIIDFVCDGAGVPTGTSMYPAQARYYLPELAEVYTQNLDKAKQLLAEAGYPKGFDMTITVPSNYAQHVDTGLVIAEQLKAVGINAEVENVEWESWVSDVYKGRNYQTTVSGIAASDMTAREMLDRYTSTHSKNFIGFSNVEFDEVVAQAIVTLDETEQIALYKRAQEILNEQAASLWLQDLCELVVLRPELDGMTFYCTYVLDMSTIYYK